MPPVRFPHKTGQQLWHLIPIRPAGFGFKLGKTFGVVGFNKRFS